MEERDRGPAAAVRDVAPQAAGKPAGPPAQGRSPAPGVAPASRPVPEPPVEFRLKAPLYDNSLSSGFFGDVMLRIDDGLLTVTGKRSQPGAGGQFMGAGLIIGFFALSSLFTGLLGFAGATVDGAGTTTAATAAGVMLGMLGLAFYLRGESITIKGGGEQTLQFDLDQTRGRKAHFDWNIGRGLALVVTPFVSLPVMLARGRRVIRLRVPVGPNGSLRTLSLRACSAAEGEAVDRALGARPSADAVRLG